MDIIRFDSEKFVQHLEPFRHCDWSAERNCLESSECKQDGTVLQNALQDVDGKRREFTKSPKHLLLKVSLRLSVNGTAFQL